MISDMSSEPFSLLFGRGREVWAGRRAEVQALVLPYPSFLNEIAEVLG